jgi:hypothetical protein|tara:strand:+ start:291 stop:758 length:468 start_codon:yes stop_codon:yes gene_type:complete
MKAKRWQYWTATGFPGIDNNQTALFVKAENKTSALKLAHEAQAILGIDQNPLLVLNNISVATLDDSDYVTVLSTGEGEVSSGSSPDSVGSLIDKLQKIQVGSNTLEIIDEAITLSVGKLAASRRKNQLNPRAIKHISDSQLITCLKTLLKARASK